MNDSNYKEKIFNDPVYGFVTLPGELIFRLVEHPYFQRLRRIKQLGLTHLVYPGALHTRFQHSLGAMHLMTEAVKNLRIKGVDISKEEETGLYVAILLHDIGHGPFSHALEHAIVNGVSHEKLSQVFMEMLDEQFGGALRTGIDIFSNRYPRKFFHQFVEGQLDMDRLDYMKRDSYFCGVAEGIINDDRILKMINVDDDQQVIEQKGIYSIEKFLIARRLMYWQVYLHKTVISAEYLLMNILRRAKYLSRNNGRLFATEPFQQFLKQEFFLEDFEKDPQVIEGFSKLDDFDIMASVKSWGNHPDPVLSELSRRLIDRRLFRIEMRSEPFDRDYIGRVRAETQKALGLEEEVLPYFVVHDSTMNYAYDTQGSGIVIRLKDGTLADIARASDQISVSSISHPEVKYFLCYPKELAIAKN